MNNVETTNRNTAFGIYVDYTSAQLMELLNNNNTTMNRNADFLPEQDLDVLDNLTYHIAMALTEIAKLKDKYPINIAPDDDTKRCPGCGEFDTFSGKYCADCTGNSAAVSGPNPQF